PEHAGDEVEDRPGVAAHQLLERGGLSAEEVPHQQLVAGLELRSRLLRHAWPNAPGRHFGCARAEEHLPPLVARSGAEPRFKRASSEWRVANSRLRIPVSGGGRDGNSG